LELQVIKSGFQNSRKKEERKHYQVGSGRWCTSGKTAGRATLLEWIYSQGFYFEATAGGEVRIVGFYNNKQTKKPGRYPT